MKLSGLHILLTYKCTHECDHCFVWGGPWQNGVLTLDQLHKILSQAREVNSLQWIYFEGGEPFLYYPILLRGVQMATAMGFHVGIVTNAFWATSLTDALTWLRPFADLIEDLTISCDLYHFSELNSPFFTNASAAAETLNITQGTISVAQPEETNAARQVGQIPSGSSAVMYRGRAATKLVGRATLKRWTNFTACPHEDLREPGRVHVDPYGNVHICQGITLGNVFTTSLREICEAYYADAHPICGPLLKNGPVGLAQEYDLQIEDQYADACHLCFESRRALRDQFPGYLLPDEMYGD
jgi:MoaA/NifB/PqqE/SkfB family radical SAM enzyme